jgi:hypothetical protein
MGGLVYPACFLTLAALTGLAASSGRRWALRLPLIAATPVLALAVWWQLAQRDGWPTGSRPASGSAFVAGVVQAPTSGRHGAIYLWAQPPNSDTPRAFRLPYSRRLERQVAQAASAARRGARVGLRARKKRPGEKKGVGAQIQSAAIQFYRLPPRRLATKDHENG